MKTPKFDFKGTNTDMTKFMATAQVLEDTGVAAYLGQVGNIKSKKILGAAGSILPVEARHAGWIRDLNNVSGAPAAFQGAEDEGADPRRRQGHRLHRRLARPHGRGGRRSPPASDPHQRKELHMPGFIGMPELLLLGLVVLMLFGPKRLPEMGRGLGKGMREFKDSISGDPKSGGVDSCSSRSRRS